MTGRELTQAIKRVALANYNLGAANTAMVLGAAMPFGKSPEECQAEADASIAELGDLLFSYVAKVRR